MRIARFIVSVLAVSSILSLQSMAAAAEAAPMAADASASSIRAQLKKLEADIPTLNPDRKDDVEYAAVHRAKEALYAVERIQLIGLLWRAEPQATDLDELMKYRWENSRRIPELKIEDEVEAYAAAHPESVEAVAAGRFQVARAAVVKNAAQPPKALAAAEGFVMQYPNDDRGAELLSIASGRMQGEEKAAVDDRIASQWPKSEPAKRVFAERRRENSVGTSFELAFTDHLTGKPVNMADLRGKVVVIDFWATWCGPCKAEIPHMKELYKTHHDSGLEIVGVSLDQAPEKGGDAKLTAYCRENELTWPQYYQGNYWDSEFSKGWGINSIPAMFVVDKKGIIRSNDARGQLDELIPMLLAEPAVE